QTRHVEVAGEPARERAGALAVGEAAEPFDPQAQPDGSRSASLRALRQDRAGSGAGRAALDPNPIRAGWCRKGHGGPGVCATACVARTLRVLPEISEDPGQALL